MKKIFFSLFAAWSLLIGSATLAQAGSNNNELKVRFRENILVVTSTQMSYTRLCDYYNGKLIYEGLGNWCEIELEQGTYILYATIDGKTVARKVILK